MYYHITTAKNYSMYNFKNQKYFSACLNIGYRMQFILHGQLSKHFRFPDIHPSIKDRVQGGNNGTCTN